MMLSLMYHLQTPRIMEAKAGPRCVVEEPAGEGGADVFLESKAS